MAEFVKGTIKKQPSLMMVVPINVENIINPEFIYYNLKNSKEFDKVYFYFNEKKKQPGIKIKYDGDEYNISFCIENFNINQNFFNLTHCISQKNIDALRKAPLGVMTSMIFGSSPVKSYFLQLKVLNCIAPDSAGIIDFSAEKIYSPIWANMACESSAAPSLTYIYSIQAVSDNKNVWLHTHGLKRCGFLELEILASSKKNYISHSDMLNEMAISVISNNNLPNELEPIFVASLPSGEVIVNTWLSYKKGIKMYEKNILGSGKNRKHFHDKNSALIFNYPNKSYYKKNTPVKISDLDDNFFNNPLVMKKPKECLFWQAKDIIFWKNILT